MKLINRIKSLLTQLLVVVLLLAIPVQAQNISEYQVKAAFIFNFTKFLQWPPQSFSNPNDPFIIGILGRNPFGSHLNDIIAGETAAGRPILVHRYVEASDIRNCHLLFITSRERIPAALNAVSGKPVLTVSDDANFCSKGGMIRFYNEGNMIKFQINTAAAKAANLEISSKLLRIAKIYE